MPNSLPTPRIEDGKSLQIAGLGGRFGNENRAQIPVLWSRFGAQYFGRVPGQLDRRAYGVGSNMDEVGNLDYLAGVEVSSFDGLPAELTRMTIDPQLYAVFQHDGHISTISRLWMAIFDGWDANWGRKLPSQPSFERYAETFDPAVAIGNVEIWIPIERS